MATISRDKREERRWNLLQARAASIMANAGGMGAFEVTDAFNGFKELFEATVTLEEQRAAEELEEREQIALAEAARQRRVAEANRRAGIRAPKTEDEIMTPMERLMRDRAARGHKTGNIG